MITITHRAVAALLLLIGAVSPVLAAPKADPDILAQTSRLVAKSEPQWKWIPGHCDCSKDYKQEAGVSVGQWERADLHRINVKISHGKSTEAAALYFEELSSALIGAGHYAPYTFADGAYMSSDRTAGPQELVYRSGSSIVFVSATSFEEAERFGSYVLRVLQPCHAGHDDMPHCGEPKKH